MKKVIIFTLFILLSFIGFGQVTPTIKGDNLIYELCPTQKVVTATTYITFDQGTTSSKWFFEVYITRTVVDTVEYHMQVCTGAPYWLWKDYAGISTTKLKQSKDTLSIEDPFGTAASNWRLKIILKGADTLTIKQARLTNQRVNK